MLRKKDSNLRISVLIVIFSEVEGASGGAEGC